MGYLKEEVSTPDIKLNEFTSKIKIKILIFNLEKISVQKDSGTPPTTTAC